MEVQKVLGFKLILPAIGLKETIGNTAYSDYRTLYQDEERSLVVCKISDELKHGVFSTIFIPEGTIIAEYTGRTILASQNHGNYSILSSGAQEDIDKYFEKLKKYTFNKRGQKYETLTLEEQRILTNEFYDLKPFFTNPNRISLIDAQDAGNIGRFFNHLPNPTTEINSMLPNIQSANLVVIHINKRPLLVTTRNILPFEQLGFDYENTYNTTGFMLFDRETCEATIPQTAFNKAGIKNLKKKIILKLLKHLIKL